ncbi:MULTISPECIES: glycosyltransferase family 4 protein [Metabacillus]|uniref:Glycosyl transferase family 1 domain-containing protein n=2 Tax=Metabacillus TaxID=2675233 RepID=A0A179T2A9_9BACI|nr:MULTISPECIES: glycosyltransferase family 4 protein [Metabacillus]OAS88187.1 hypothetical protein A6K24_17585 [Metabacillus litoralis]QNF27382.1 glycosyltransferase family 4 protein [Metabacillus sp. KUDC1714]
MDKKFKICFFSGDISRNGGTERVSTIIANELVKRGHEVSFLSYRNGLKSYYYIDERIPLYSLGMENYNGFLSRKLMPYKKLISFFKTNKTDIVIDIDVLLSIYTLPIKKIIGTKIISWEHFNLRENRIKTRVIARRLATFCSDSIVTLNKNDMENYVGITPSFYKNKIRYIYNPAIAKYETKTNLKNKTVIAVGRLTYQKNFHLLIKLWKEIEILNPKWNLIIVGEGEDKKSLDELISHLGVKNVVITGFKENIEKIYEESSIMVMTSRYEGLPMVLLEGQKKGLPIVAFNCPTGPAEIIINGRNGYLIDIGDQQEFIKKLHELINDYDKLKEFSSNAIKDSEKFNLTSIIDNWIKLFYKLN